MVHNSIRTVRRAAIPPKFVSSTLAFIREISGQTDARRSCPRITPMSANHQSRERWSEERMIIRAGDHGEKFLSKNLPDAGANGRFYSLAFVDVTAVAGSNGVDLREFSFSFTTSKSAF